MATAIGHQHELVVGIDLRASENTKTGQLKAVETQGKVVERQHKGSEREMKGSANARKGSGRAV